MEKKYSIYKKRYRKSLLCCSGSSYKKVIVMWFHICSPEVYLVIVKQYDGDAIVCRKDGGVSKM